MMSTDGSKRAQFRTLLFLLLSTIVATSFPGTSFAEAPYPIVFVHGLYSSANVWVDANPDVAGDQGIVPHLLSLGYTDGGVINFALGQGDELADVSILSESVESNSGDLWRINFDATSVPHSNEAAIFLQAKALQLAIDRILGLTGREKVVVVGHSMGGLAGALYLVGGPDIAPSSTFYRGNVAKLVTLGTPFGGSFLANLADITWKTDSTAIRDLAQNTLSHRNVFLFGGNESQVSNEFYKDVNCDGDGGQSLVRGLREYSEAEWPADVDLFWVVGRWVNLSDCVVEEVDQYLTFGERKPVRARHSLNCPTVDGTDCSEPMAFDVIIEAMDEPGDIDRAWKVSTPSSIRGFLTSHENPGVDYDVYRIDVVGAGRLQASLTDISVPDTSLRLLDATGDPCAGSCAALGDSGTLTVWRDVVAPGGATFYLEVAGWVEPSNAALSLVQNACDPDDTDCPNCRHPYRLNVNSGIGSSTVQLSASPTLVTLGSSSLLTASVKDPAGQPVAGVGVTFSTGYLGSFSGCSGPRSACVTTTNAAGVAQVSLSSNIPGAASVQAQASTGGVSTTTIEFRPGTLFASASPNPVQVEMPSVITVAVRDGAGSSVGAGVPVTFRTSFPGIFSGNGAGNPSPQTVYTDASGETWIRFTGTATGTAYLTIEVPNTDGTVLPLEIAAPTSDITVHFAVGFAGGTSSSSDFELETLVVDAGGAPIVGEHVTFTASRGSLLSTSCNTGPTGVCDVTLRVTSSGEVTATATARGVTTATTFYAQVGLPSCSDMVPVRTLTMGSAEAQGVAYSPDGTVLVASDWNGNVKAWNTSDGSLKWSKTTRDNRATHVSMSPDGTKVLVNHDDGQDVFSVSNGSLICSADIASGEEAVNGVFVSNTSHFHGSDGTSTNPPQLYRHASLCGGGSSVMTMPGSDDFQEDGHMDFSSAKNWIAFGSHEGNLYVRNASTGGSVRTEAVTAGSDDGFDVDFSADGSKLLAVGWRVVKVYNTSSWSASGYNASTLGDWIYGAKFIDGDSKIALGGRGQVEILNAVGGSCFRKATINGYGLEIDWSASRKEMAISTSTGRVQIFKPLEFDIQPPVISIFTPTANQQTNQSALTTTGHVEDNYSVTVFKINGTSAVLDANGNFSSSLTLVEGLNTITYYAEDSSGNGRTETRQVTLFVDRAAPVVSATTVLPTSGLAGTVFTLETHVVDGDSGVQSVTATIRDGASVQVGSPISMTHISGDLYRGSFYSSASPVGFYTVDIRAVDTSAQANTRVVSAATGFEVEPPPALSRSPGSLDFGSVATFADRTLTVTNTGGGVLYGSASTSPPFSVVSGSSYALQRGQSVQVTIRFTPKTVGAMAGNVALTGGGGGSVSVTGYGDVPAGIFSDGFESGSTSSWSSTVSP